MKIERFIEAIDEEPNCCTCRFFVPGSNGFVLRVGKELHVHGTCRRNPPVLTRLEKGRESEHPAEFGQPPIKIVVSEIDEGETWVSSDGTSGFTEEEVPWCGEWREQAHDYEILQIDEDKE